MKGDAKPGTPPRVGAANRARQIVSGHPVIVGVIVGSVVIGAVVGVLLLPAEWTLVRRVLGGAVGGAGCGLICTAPRIVG